ncbi:hypothetical protein [Paractinoplanes brasiliensis]|uniref:Uncharacterized protein n=1 Tax=Paractinoplanes brasiliensis TaxID=52695 RepID=A0A4R6K036_9ACTN|nr:hypothetical protein [Actinoplanes brasiliensis]TDO41552.1 hypothetical protein C8E87_5287 [Actinoplanes brasiliensis]GID27160.1 hypothetical protein Abr02nite_21430 [Actinoplanes brasiliensis]
MYLVPPMDDEPPPEYVDFVTHHLDDLRRETNRLVGGDTEAAHIYMDVLADVACHWRRLAWRRRLLGRPHAVREYMQHRLAVRTKQWRDEQIYEVDVRVLPPPAYSPAFYRRGGSLALRKAELIPGTVRRGVVASADAGIAWCQAYRRQQWHAVGRRIVLGVLLIATMIQTMQWLSVDY